MKKTVEEKAELAKLKIDKKLQKQQKKAEQTAVKKQEAAAKKTAKKEAASLKKEAKKQLSAQQKAAKKEAADLKKKAKQEAADKMKALKSEAKQAKAASKGTNEKIDTEKGENVEVKKGNKKKIFAVVLALVFVGCGTAGFLLFRSKNKEEVKDPYIEAYVLDDDFVPSIPKFLEESEKRELPEIIVEGDGANKQIIYNYTEVEDAADEVKDYVNFLTNENEFVPMFDFNLDAPGGYVSIAKASEEEGKILKMDIDYTDSDYKVMVKKSDEKLPKPKEKDTDKDVTRDGAFGYLSKFSAEELGLEKPIEEYKAVYDAGQSSIGSRNYYGITLYELGVAGTNEFVSKFFVATNQNGLFRYDSSKDTYVEIETPSKATARQSTPLQQTGEQTGENASQQQDSQQNENIEQQHEEESEKEQTDKEKKEKENKNAVQKGRKSR